MTSWAADIREYALSAAPVSYTHLDVYKRQREDDVCAVCVLHDLSLAGWFCDRIALMLEGSVYAFGTPVQVLTRENVLSVYGVDRCV